MIDITIRKSKTRVGFSISPRCISLKTLCRNSDAHPQKHCKTRKQTKLRIIPFETFLGNLRIPDGQSPQSLHPLIHPDSWGSWACALFVHFIPSGFLGMLGACNNSALFYINFNSFKNCANIARKTEVGASEIHS